jgi:hypothetical protein
MARLVKIIDRRGRIVATGSKVKLCKNLDVLEQVVPQSGRVVHRVEPWLLRTFILREGRAEREVVYRVDS